MYKFGQTSITHMQLALSIDDIAHTFPWVLQLCLSTLLQKKSKILEVSFGENCMPVDLRSYNSGPLHKIIKTLSQGQYPGAPGKMNRLNWHFFWRKVYCTCMPASACSIRSTQVWRIKARTHEFPFSWGSLSPVNLISFRLPSHFPRD